MIDHSRRTKVILLILVGALVGMASLAGMSLLDARSATAQSEPSSGQPEYPSALKIFTCSISELAVHRNGDRIHIRCNPGDGAIAYFAASSAPAEIAHTNQLLTLANTAYALGKQVSIWYDTDSAQNPPGCLSSDCRKLIGLVLRP